MSLIDLSPVFPYQQNSWETFTEFYKHLQKLYLDKSEKLWFDGEGAFVSTTENISEEFFLFSINNVLYASALLSSQGQKVFSGIIELNKDFLLSPYFKKIAVGYSKKYRVFDASINIDLKPYDYGEEHKLLFSKAEKVDLLFSQHLIYSGDNVTFEVKASQSLKPTIEWQKKVNDINKKMEQLLAEKRAKK